MNILIYMDSKSSHVADIADRLSKGIVAAEKRRLDITAEGPHRDALKEDFELFYEREMGCEFTFIADFHSHYEPQARLEGIEFQIAESDSYSSPVVIPYALIDAVMNLSNADSVFDDYVNKRVEKVHESKQEARRYLMLRRAIAAAILPRIDKFEVSLLNDQDALQESPATAKKLIDMGLVVDLGGYYAVTDLGLQVVTAWENTA